MSLNGLESPGIQEAYARSVVEAGGWFLLKYTSRDSVELLARGTSGVHEARYAIAKYSDPSPLYGLIMYRRRRVLIKYIPEGTSRLLQARTAVHFQDILERYSPYETLLEIKTAEGLNDTSLAASFPLHTASPSASSSRLHEISEDGEDSGPTARKSTLASASSGSIFGTKRYKMEKRVDQLMSQDRLTPPRRPTPSVSLSSDGVSSTLSSPVSSPRKTTMSQFLVRDDSGQRSITSIGTEQSFASMTDYTDLEAASSTSGAATPTQSAPGAEQLPPELPRDAPSLDRVNERPATSQPSDYEPSDRSVQHPRLPEHTSKSEIVRKYASDDIDWSKFEPKPKVRLAPRPVAGAERTKRPMVASISTVPPTYRPAQQKKPESSRPKSQVLPVGVLAGLPPSFPAPPPVPTLPEYNPRPVSRGSVKSLPSHRSTTMTPDKIRLMKAVELRKKQMRKSNPAASTYKPPQDEEIPGVPVVPKAPEAYAPKTQKRQDIDNEVEKVKRIDDELQANKADSGIEMDYNAFEKKGEDLPDVPPSEDSSQQTADPETRARSEDRAIGEDTCAAPGVSLHSQDVSQQRIQTVSPQPKSKPAVALDDSAKVPTIQIADGSRPITSNREHAQIQQQQEDIIDDKDADGEELSALSTVATSRNPKRKDSDLAKRRRGIVEPLQIDTDAELTSDDDLFEELQAATVQEAKHITVSKSPVTASFRRRPSAQSMVSFKSGMSARAINIARKSSSGALLDLQPDGLSERQSPTPPLPSPPLANRSSLITSPSDSGDATTLKRNVSTGISKRIQALHEMTSRETSPVNTPRAVSPEMARETLSWKDRKSAVRSPLRSRGSSLHRQSFRMNASAAHDAPSTTTVYKVQHDTESKRDSVSVSARIVRPCADAHSQDMAITEQMQQPQLTINHNRASVVKPVVSPLTSALPPLNTNSLPPVARPESGSTLTDPNQARGSTEYRTFHSANPKPFSRHKHNLSAGISPASPHADDFPAPPPSANASAAPSASFFEHDTTPKEMSSRTSRFFKRMSNLGAKRKSGVQQSTGLLASAAETSSLAPPRASSIATEGSKSDMPPAVVIGNLNIQFPDTLLWKRRMVEIDDSGNLTFSIPHALDIQKGVAKRYHLTDFRMPYDPDLDRQELPHSVMLDFLDGGTTLQAACEDATTHGQVLHVLRSHWKAWSSS